MPALSDRTIPQRQKRDHLEWMHTFRFIEEVHRVEADGRVLDRPDLERRLLLPAGGVAIMRSGKVRVPTAAIELLKREFNGDLQYVLIGVRDEDRSSYMQGPRDLRVHPDGGYAYKYQSAAADLRQKAGLPPLEAEATEKGRPSGGRARSAAAASLNKENAQLLRAIREIVRQELGKDGPE